MKPRRMVLFALPVRCPRCGTPLEEELTTIDVGRVLQMIGDGLDPQQNLRLVRCSKSGCPRRRFWVKAKAYQRARAIGQAPPVPA